MNFTEAKQKAKEKFIQGKNWVVDKTRKGFRWVINHPDEVAVFATAVTVVTTTGVKVVKAIDQHEEKHRYDKQVWDPSAGLYWEIKRPMKDSEKGEYERQIADAKRKGEIVERGEILRSMGLR